MLTRMLTFVKAIISHVVAFRHTLDRCMERPTLGGEIILILD